MRPNPRSVAWLCWTVLAAGCLDPCAADDPACAAVPSAAEEVTWRSRTGPSRRAYLLDELTRHNAPLEATARRQKYEAMRASPFAFFRGSAHLFHRDAFGGPSEAPGPLRRSPFAAPDAVTWVLGDAHTANFGAFDDDRGQVVYDLNDFDEAWVASYVLDVWRLATSVALVAGENGTPDGAERAELLEALAEGYLSALEGFRGNDLERDAQVTEANAYGRLDEFLDEVARDRSRRELLDDWTLVSGGRRRLRDDDPRLGAATADERAALAAGVTAYREGLTSDLRRDAGYFRVLDVARRLDAGTGSLGTARYYLLVEGPSGSLHDDRILDVKRQGSPSFLRYLSSQARAAYGARFPEGRAGCRVASAQRAMLARADDHAGCLSALGGSFSVRERTPARETLDTRGLDSGPRLRHLVAQWASILAAAHARADRDFDPGYVQGSFEDAALRAVGARRSRFRAEVRQVAVAYAAQVAVDHALFVAALEQGALR
ncbi:MAG: DUF2252 family protein [Deltaproteobacteria bacterium]|nr:DUF2252 family protein [Deltaproteobacteria bacterium]